MTIVILTLGILAQLFLVTGQLWLKHALNETDRTPVPWRRVVPRFSAGIVALTFWFFIWLGLMQKRDLSYIYPLEGLSFVLTILGASIFLRERINRRAWVGVALITAGIALVTTS